MSTDVDSEVPVICKKCKHAVLFHTYSGRCEVTDCKPCYIADDCIKCKHPMSEHIRRFEKAVCFRHGCLCTMNNSVVECINLYEEETESSSVQAWLANREQEEKPKIERKWVA